MALVDKKEECCGCAACMNICPVNAITMQPDDEGFLYPKIGKGCVGCNACVRVCPMKKQLKTKTPVAAYGIKHKNDQVRNASSSGGAFTALSNVILDAGGCVFACELDEKLRAKHVKASNRAERDACRGSKYVQSEMNLTFRQVKTELETGAPVMFVGTACQVAGLNSFLEGTNTDGLLTVDFVCHGVPSPKLFEDYKKYIEKNEDSKLSGYYFRPKDNGWGHCEKAVFLDGYSMTDTMLTDVWKNVFYSNNALRPSCYECHFASMNRVSDITIGDFWGIDDVNSDFNDKQGVSIALFNSARGKVMFDCIKEHIDFFECAADSSRNPNLEHPTSKPDTHDIFWAEYRENGFDFIARKYGQNSFSGKVKRQLRKLLSR